MKYLKWLIIILPLSFLLLLTLFGSIIGNVINNHFQALDKRYGNNQLTNLDKAECLVLYHTMAAVGQLSYPEAGQILEHYLEGTGEDLWLDPTYLKTSPVVVRNLKSMRVGEIREVRFHQKEDWQLSYALNPFSIKNDRNKVLVYQKIIFPSEKGVYTNLNLFIFKITLPDRLIHVVNP